MEWNIRAKTVDECNEKVLLSKCTCEYEQQNPISDLKVFGAQAQDAMAKCNFRVI